MKKLILSAALVVAVTGACSDLFAGARSPSNLGREYAVGTSDLGRWSCGAYVDAWSRDLNVLDSPFESTVDSSKYMAFVGYDVLDWMNAYVSMGQNNMEFDDTGDDGQSLAVGAGLQFNILDVDVPDPGLLEDRLRLNASLEGLYTTADYMDDTISWGEIYADVTVALVNDSFGFSFLSPESVSLFTGPFYAGLIGSDLEGGDASFVGWTIGAEMFLTKRVSLNGRYNAGAGNGYTAGLNVRF